MGRSDQVGSNGNNLGKKLKGPARGYMERVTEERKDSRSGNFKIDCIRE